MTNIKELPIELINLISAGEVVERYSSVVKELVENSIDAKSDYIEVNIKSLDKIKITIIDNGDGMTKEDILQAIKPHSTSKIKVSDDLFNINTLGFRGEAIPSILAVSKTTICSKKEGFDLGYFYSFEGNLLTTDGSYPMNKGTKIVVEDLFFNTPARFKNLNSIRKEISIINNYLIKCILSHPYISFKYVLNDEVIYQTSKDSNILDLLGILYGTDVSKNIISFNDTYNLFKIKGYSTNQNISRTNKSGITIILNGRIIENNLLIYGVIDAYSNMLIKGKYPISVIYIECESDLIDCNVHPAKNIVRITDEYLLKTFITKSLLKAFESSYNTYFTNQLDLSDSVINESDEENSKIDEKEALNNKFNSDIEFKYDYYNYNNTKVNSNITWDSFKEETDIKYNEIDCKINNYKLEPIDNKFKFTNLSYIGDFNETYLLFEYNSTLYLLDQHACAERINYELIIKSFKNSTINESIELLIPIEINYDSLEYENIKELDDKLINLGFKLEYLNNNTIKYKSVPIWIKHEYLVESINNIIEFLLNNKIVSKDTIYHDIACTIACKKSLKAHMKVNLKEVNDLLINLDKCDNPYACPHGRPTLIKFSKYELEKMFMRVE